MINSVKYKRQNREMPQYVKDKISAKLRGRKLSDETKKRIADGQRRAWEKIPLKQDVSTLWPTSQDNNNDKDNNELCQEKKE